MKYLLLGNSGLRVSELCLGTMTFGTEWGYGADKAESQNQFNAFLDAGGNFVDTANRYTDGTSETYIGEFMAPIREQIVLATKYSLRTSRNGVNDGGNHRKNLVQSVTGSLKRLNTDYIDLLYLHAWDSTTPVEEVMRSLEYLVQSGKVLYIAISDTPAWLVSRANTIAELRGWSPFIGLQIEYSLIQRTVERDLVPMADAMELGITAWAPIAGGALSGKYLNQESGPKRLKPESARLNERATNIVKVVNQVAAELGCSSVQVALQWLRQQKAQVIPVIGARTTEQLKESLACLNFKIADEQMQRLNEVSKIEPGFPHDFLVGPGVSDVLFNGYREKIEPKTRK